MIPYDMLLLFVLLLLKAYPYHNLHKEISHIENDRLFRLLAICFCGCGYNSTCFLLRLSQDMLDVYKRQPINIDQETRHITLAYFDQKSTVDYIGACLLYTSQRLL